MMKKSLLLIAFFLLAQLSFSQTPVAKSNITQVKVPATLTQILGKWHIIKVLKGKTEIPAAQIQGSTFIFGADQLYQTKILGVDEAGSWQFGPEHTSIIMIVKGQKTIWNILKANDTELIMQKGIRGNTVTFSKNE